MTELIRIDFKQKKLLGKHHLADLAGNVYQEYTCICCNQKYNNDKNSAGYCEAISWQVRTSKGNKTLHICKHCVNGAYSALNGNGEE